MSATHARSRDARSRPRSRTGAARHACTSRTPKREPLAEPPSRPVGAAPARSPARLPFEDWFRGRHPAIPTAGALATAEAGRRRRTVPFIARYRKEQTGGLDEVAIQTVIESRARFDPHRDAPGLDPERHRAPEEAHPRARGPDSELLRARGSRGSLACPTSRSATSKASRRPGKQGPGFAPLGRLDLACGHGTRSVPQIRDRRSSCGPSPYRNVGAGRPRRRAAGDPRAARRSSSRP